MTYAHDVFFIHWVLPVHVNRIWNKSAFECDINLIYFAVGIKVWFRAMLLNASLPSDQSVLRSQQCCGMIMYAKFQTDIFFSFLSKIADWAVWPVNKKKNFFPTFF